MNFSFCFVFVFETDLLETTYLTNGWHTLRVIRYKIKFQHTKKVKNTFDRNYFYLQKFITYNLHILLDQELSSPFTKTKKEKKTWWISNIPSISCKCTMYSSKFLTLISRSWVSSYITTLFTVVIKLKRRKSN